ncbi:hypothetical protein C5167_046518 [Papaver somniferum]|uniref:Uncharacterized protein n=1 Tax=Papaver somniferum TaxID=3469 RepID=A0A4Y7LFL2_PAPSO|nr:hypothetical protein C5167_046518 [Papaver somniferum]
MVFFYIEVPLIGSFYISAFLKNKDARYDSYSVLETGDVKDFPNLANTIITPTATTYHGRSFIGKNEI